MVFYLKRKFTEPTLRATTPNRACCFPFPFYTGQCRSNTTSSNYTHPLVLCACGHPDKGWQFSGVRSFANITRRSWCPWRNFKQCEETGQSRDGAPDTSHCWQMADSVSRAVSLFCIPTSCTFDYFISASSLLNPVDDRIFISYVNSTVPWSQTLSVRP